MFEKVLIANRGEISIRVARTLKEMGIGSVAVYSEIDRDAPHVREADEAFLLGPAVPAESYLNILKIIDVAREAGAEAIHPGYGFLAENADFARACAEAGIVFIGPPPEAIDAMGSKTRAREIMAEAGVPIVPGATAPAKDLDEARQQANEAGYPVACKAAGGGGGKGFRVAMTPDDLQEAFEGAAREGEKFFSDARVYVERYLEDPRHVEVQVLADGHGNVIHVGERDCSVQRRHQKVIEEAPAPRVDEEMRERIGKVATDAAAAVGYRSAGTVEGLQVGDEYFFLEMNTRVQVEHCVTEMVSGIDIVREQMLIAAGEPLSVAQEDVSLRGHAIECRINAEAAHKKFAPAPGAITTYREPAGPGVRVDSGVEAGSEVTPMYDPMVAKLIVWDVDREASTRRMIRALHEYEIGGLKTLIPFHQTLLATEQWKNGETCRDLVEDKDWLKQLAFDPPPATDADDEEEPKVARDYAVE
ncbi:MAG TPA: acetyl-CoA carboxylase biotin carboxylase subunit, partial [Solirubrobacterales bacterium]|nr:acetyl-CoA carboxylase biotin carboxylase subunit [Solirubrobacterales bacterium]